MVVRKLGIVISGLVCALMLGGLSLAHAQQKKEGRSKGEVRRISTVIGGSVQFSAGGNVGKIEDIVISDEGCIEYIVVAYHDRYVPIPWTVSTVAYDKRIVTISIEQARFEEVPTFSRDEFALLVQGDFRDKVHTFFGAGSRKENGAKEDKATKPDPKAKAAEKRTEKATPDPKKADEKATGDKKPDEKKAAEKATTEKKSDEKKSDEKKTTEKKSDEKKDKPGGQ